MKYSARYIDSYARTIAATKRFEDINRNVADEQSKVQYIDSLIQSEKQNLTNLSEVYRVRPQDLGAAQTLLQDRYAAEDAQRKREAGARRARENSLKLPKSVKESIENNLLSINQTVPNRGRAMDEVQTFIGGKKTTKEQADAAIQKLADAKVGKAQVFSDNEIGRLRALAQRQKFADPPSGKARKLTDEEEAAERALEQQLQAAFFAGPAGIRGGYDGQAIVERRETTAAPENVSFSTEQDAYMAAIEASSIGEVTRASFQSDEDFIFAKKLYDEAKAKQAYRNDERVNFENDVLASRKRVVDLETQKAESPAAKYNDPAKEAMRRELIARGYDPAKNGGRFVQFQKSAYYDNMVAADDIINEVIQAGEGLSPVSKAQRYAQAMIQKFDAAGKPYKLDDVAKQLSKVLSGKELSEGLTYALAFKEYATRNLDKPGQVELQRKAREQAKKDAERLEAQAVRDRAETAEARARQGQLEREQTAAVTQLRGEQAKANLPAKEYARLRAMGMSQEEARAKAMQVAQPVATAPLADEVLMEPAMLIERQRRAPDAPVKPLKMPPMDFPAAEVKPLPAEAEALPDPTDPDYAYRKAPSGDYLVIVKGLPTGVAKKGTRAHASIESVLSGGAPVAPAPRKASPPTFTADPNFVPEGPPMAGAGAAPEEPVPAPPKKPRRQWNPTLGRMEEVPNG